MTALTHTQKVAFYSINGPVTSCSVLGEWAMTFSIEIGSSLSSNYGNQGVTATPLSCLCVRHIEAYASSAINKCTFVISVANHLFSFDLSCWCCSVSLIPISSQGKNTYRKVVAGITYCIYDVSPIHRTPPQSELCHEFSYFCVVLFRSFKWEVMQHPDEVGTKRGLAPARFFSGFLVLVTPESRVRRWLFPFAGWSILNLS